MEDMKLIAKKRTAEGSANARRMRNTGALPAVIYGDSKEPASIELNVHDFEQVLHHSASESIIIDIELEGEGNVSVLVKEVQHHPVTSDLVHVDFLRMVAGKAISVDIAIELVGEPEGVKAGGTLDHTMHSISVECLPSKLVEAFEVDVSDLEIGQSLHVSDLELGSDFKLLADGENIVASVAAPRTEEEDEEAEEADVAAGAEPEVIGEKKEEEAE